MLYYEPWARYRAKIVTMSDGRQIVEYYEVND